MNIRVCASCGAALGRAYLLSRRLERLRAHTGLGKDEKKKNPPGCTAPLFIHLFELHMSAGTAGSRPRPQAAGIGLGLGQPSGSDGRGWQPTQTGESTSGGGKEDIVEIFFCGGFKSVEWLLEPCSWNAFRHHSEMEHGALETLCASLIVIIKGILYF